MQFVGKNILVVGSGVSGISACELLTEERAHITLLEGNQNTTVEAVRGRSAAFEDVEIIIGELPEKIAETLDMVVLSPGVPTDQPWIAKLQESGVVILGEIELAYQLSKGKIVAITGTNGKTTTTALTGEIMANYFADVKVVGNIGIPYTSVARATTDETVTVAEISSFQLETVVDFKPQVTAILNITPDHLDRHHNMANYARIKESITKNQTAEDTCVLNYEDELLRQFGEKVHTKVLFFSSRQKLAEGYYLDGEDICFASEGVVTKLININELNVLGAHNYENVMAASAMAMSIGIPFEKIKEVLVRFQAVEHRIEYVTEKRGIKFYNDSKGTNTDAAIKGISAMNRPTCLIGGGYDKGAEYDEWIEAFDGKVKKLVLLGATREAIAECAKKHGFTNIAFAEDLAEAVTICYQSAQPGEAVLLSPACASWGMFKNYEERGCVFKEIVHGLKE